MFSDRPERQRRYEAAPVHDPAGRHDRYAHRVHNLRDQRQGSDERCLASRAELEGRAVTAGLGPLSHDHVGPAVQDTNVLLDRRDHGYHQRALRVRPVRLPGSPRPRSRPAPVR